MHELGNYKLQVIAGDGWTVRYEATHVVLPRRAIIELVEPAAPKSTALTLMRRACILEALHHPNVPRVFECGMFEGRPWVAFERSDDITLRAELHKRHLQVGEVMDLLEQVGAILSHAHALGVLHLNITASAIVRHPSLLLTGWESACPHNPEQPHEWRADVLALGKVALEAIAELRTVPAALASLLAKMLGDEEGRPTAADVVAMVRAIRAPDLDEAVDAAVDSLIDDSYEVVIEYANTDGENEPVLLETRRRTARWTPRMSVAQHVEIVPPARRAVDDGR